MSNYSLYDRILGSLVTAGMGDAVGVPSDAFSRDEVIEKFGHPIDFFYYGGDNAYAIGNNIAEITDDSSQMFEMCKAVIETNGELTIEAAANALVAWTRNWPKYYPRNCGPTMANWVIDYLKGGDPIELAKIGKLYGRGTSNGCAMRCASSGLVNPGNLDKAIETAATMTRVSHGTHAAISGTCAIACAIAEGMMENSSVLSVARAALYGAENGEALGRKIARVSSGANVHARLKLALDIAVNAPNPDAAADELEAVIGTRGDIAETVPLTIGLFVANDGDPIKTILAAANIGGDTDTNACIAGSVAGAYAGFSAIPDNWYAEFKPANPQLDLEWAARELAKIAEKRM